MLSIVVQREVLEVGVQRSRRETSQVDDLCDLTSVTRYKICLKYPEHEQHPFRVISFLSVTLVLVVHFMYFNLSETERHNLSSLLSFLSFFLSFFLFFGVEGGGSYSCCSL